MRAFLIQGGPLAALAERLRASEARSRAAEHRREQQRRRPPQGKPVDLRYHR